MWLIVIKYDIYAIYIRNIYMQYIKNTKTSKNIQQYLTTTCVINCVLYDCTNKSRTEWVFHHLFWRIQLSTSVYNRTCWRQLCNQLSIVELCNIVVFLHSKNPYLHSVSRTLCNKSVYMRGTHRRRWLFSIYIYLYRYMCIYEGDS